MKLRPLFVALLAIAAPACNAQPQATPSADAAAALAPLEVRTSAGVRKFSVEVARTPDEQAQGLMYRTSLPADGGMIFPFVPPRPASFWMKNTVIPLDMIFIRTDGTIAVIAANTVPNSLDPVTSLGEPMAAVLELAGGRAAELGIAEGDKVTWQDSAAAR